MRSSARWEGVGLVVVSLVLARSGALGAQSPHPWSLGLQVGRSQIHRQDLDHGGRIVAWSFGRDIDRRGLTRWRVELGTSHSLGESFAFLRAAPELRLFPRSPVTPFGTASAGFVTESEYCGPAFTAGGGLVAALGPRVALRGEITRGTHGGEPGPHALTAGVELRLGRPRIAS